MVVIKAEKEKKPGVFTLKDDILYITDHIGALQILDYDKYYEELQSVGVTLDADPVQYGLRTLNEKIAAIDYQKTRIGYILTEGIKNESDIEQVCSLIDRVYKKHRVDVLLQDKITELANQGLRDAAVEKELKTLLDQQNDMHRCIMKAKAFTKIVKQKFDILDSTNKNISRQLTTVEAMINLGEVARIER